MRAFRNPVLQVLKRRTICRYFRDVFNACCLVPALCTLMLVHLGNSIGYPVSSTSSSCSSLGVSSGGPALGWNLEGKQQESNHFGALLREAPVSGPKTEAQARARQWAAAPLCPTRRLENVVFSHPGDTLHLLSCCPLSFGGDPASVQFVWRSLAKSVVCKEPLGLLNQPQNGS